MFNERLSHIMSKFVFLILCYLSMAFVSVDAQKRKVYGSSSTHHLADTVQPKHVSSASQLINKKQRRTQKSPRYKAWVQTGTLKSNIQRLAKQFHWEQVVWQLPVDYRLVGHYSVTGQKETDLFEHLIEQLPVQLIFYKTNRTLLVKPAYYL